MQKLHLADAKVILKERPKAVLKALGTAWFTYFLPATDFPFFDHNRPKIAKLDRFLNVVLQGQFLDASNRKLVRAAFANGPRWKLPFYTGTFLIIGLPLLCGLALWRMWRGDFSTGRAFTISFLLFNIAFVTAVSNLASCYENNRYRFSLDAFYVVLAGLALTWFLDRKGPQMVPSTCGASFSMREASASPQKQPD